MNKQLRVLILNDNGYKINKDNKEHNKDLRNGVFYFKIQRICIKNNIFYFLNLKRKKYLRHSLCK